MGMPTHTRGEVLFEQYLASQHLPFEFEKEQTGKSKRPDYTIEWHERMIVFDVKDFDPLDPFPTGYGYLGAYDPYPRIREKIGKARDKFKEYKECCCALVLRNLGNPLVRLYEPDIMLGSMYGDSGITFPVNTSTGVGDASKMKPAFLGRGKMIQPDWSHPENTTISAIITLSAIRPDNVLLVEMWGTDPARDIAECEAELQSTIPDFDPNREIPRVIVWHNAFARIPFPEDIFCSPFDTHFGVVKAQDGMFQNVTYRGKELPDSVEV